MKKVMALLFTLLFVLSAAIASGCEKQTELRQVVLNEVTRSVFYAPLYIAVSKGFFAQEGMEIEIVTGGGSDKSMTALLAGDAQVALMGPETVVYVANQGKEDHPVIVAQLTKRDGSFLLGREEDTAFEWSKLKGKSVIGGRPGGMPYMTLCYVLKQHGLTPGVDVTVIDNVQFNLMGGAFEGGTGDYVTLFEPNATLFDNLDKGHIVASVGRDSGEVPYTAFMVSKSMTQEDPEFVNSFVRAISRGQKYVQSASDEELAKAMQPFFPDSDIDTLKIVVNSYRAIDAWTDTPVMSESAFNRLQDIMESAGELTARVSFTEVVDNTFAQKVIAEK